MKTALAALLLLAGAGAHAEDKVVRSVGYAYDLVDNQYAFTQVDERQYSGNKWVGGTTTYYGPDGKEWGHKTLDFTADPLLPVYKLQFPNRGYAEAINSVSGDEIALMRRADNKMAKGRIKKEGVMVANAGLAQFLDAHFDELLKGATLQFTLVAPSRLETYKFKAAKAEEPATFEGKPAVQIKVDMDSLLKLFAGPLTFTYDSATRKMVEFRGTSEVLNAANDNKPYEVRLIYPSAPPKDAPPLPAGK